MSRLNPIGSKKERHLTPMFVQFVFEFGELSLSLILLTFYHLIKRHSFSHLCSLSLPSNFTFEM